MMAFLILMAALSGCKQEYADKYMRDTCALDCGAKGKKLKEAKFTGIHLIFDCACED